MPEADPVSARARIGRCVPARAVRAGACLAMAITAGCADAPPRAPVQRLLPADASTPFAILGDVWMRAVRLSSGESHQAQAQVTPGSALVLSLAGDPWPGHGAIRLEVLANGRSVFEAFEKLEDERWSNVRVPLDAEGPTDIEIRVRHVRGNGGPLDPSRIRAGPWILLGAPRVVPQGPADARRLLVWVSQETLRADHLGSYGYERSTSPNFDRLAQDWIVFDQAIAAASWTFPSIASQFTSRYPSWHGAVKWNAKRDAEAASLFETLAHEGFLAVGVVTNRFMRANNGMTDGFDMLWQAGTEAADGVNRQVEEALDACPDGDLAVFVHYFDPHNDYEAPPPYDRMFETGYQGPVDGHNFNKIPISMLDPPALEHLAALYDGEIAYTDSQISKLFERARTLPGSDRSVVVYSADHGEAFLEHGSITHGGNLHEELIRVPLALRLPGFRAQRVAQPVSLIDLAPTLLEAFGIPAPASFHGQSLLPLLRTQGAPRRMVYSEVDEKRDQGQWIAVRDGHWKYHALFEMGSVDTLKTELLYDLSQDPRETRPIQASPHSARLRQAAVAYRRAASNRQPGLTDELDDETKRELRALGYLQ